MLHRSPHWHKGGCHGALKFLHRNDSSWASRRSSSAFMTDWLKMQMKPDAMSNRLADSLGGKNDEASSRDAHSVRVNRGTAT